MTKIKNTLKISQISISAGVKELKLPKGMIGRNDDITSGIGRQ
jgi:hypothetical protein